MASQPEEESQACMASQPKEESQACMASQPKEESQACMASQPKEESQSDPVEDEVLIMNVLRKVGFHAQQRCRMLLLDTRLCYLADCDLRPWHARRRCCSRRWG